MQNKWLIQLLLPAALVHGQSLSNALASQNASLSMLNSILASQPNLLQSLNNANNVTVLAPNNDAINNFLSGNSSPASDLLTAVLQYHVLIGTYYASDITSMKGPAFVPTLLTNQTYTNVTGGQRVEARAQEGAAYFISGLGQRSNVTTANVNYTGGTIHIIDSVLSLPTNDSATLSAANLTALAGALTQTKLVQSLSGQADVTIFAPNNEAFNAIGNLVANLTADQLSTILKYHVIAGSVIYSSSIRNTTAKAFNNEDLTFTVDNGDVFVNSAKVIQPNILVANGVVHVIDNVLNPSNTAARPDSAASTQAPAFSGATGTNNVPFTSGVPTPTASGPLLSGTSTGLAVPVKTGVVRAAALFGGAAFLVNL